MHKNQELSYKKMRKNYESRKKPKQKISKKEKYDSNRPALQEGRTDNVFP